MRFLKKYWHWLVVSVLFVVVIFFLAEMTVKDVQMVRANIEQLSAERDRYRAKIVADSTFLENLKQDSFLEKYAREKFYMKQSGEEIFVIYEDSLVLKNSNQ